MGQTKKLTVVRFIVADTIEHEMFLRNYARKERTDDEGDEL